MSGGSPATGSVHNSRQLMHSTKKKEKHSKDREVSSKKRRKSVSPSFQHSRSVPFRDTVSFPFQVQKVAVGCDFEQMLWHFFNNFLNKSYYFIWLDFFIVGHACSPNICYDINSNAITGDYHLYYD